ncbi:MAG TPA: hypothetical protein VIM89_18650 [Mucilaginibacter sp.]
MKRHLILSLSLIVASFAVKASPRFTFNTIISGFHQDALTDYTGKYELSRDTNLYVIIKIQDGALVATQSWDKVEKHLDHLNGDNFIIAGQGWSVEFVRGGDKKVAKLIVSAKDVWNKVSK